MNTSAQGKSFIKGKESFSPVVYYVAGVPHIGYGFNKNVWNLPDEMTRHEADVFFDQILNTDFEPRVRAGLSRPVSRHEFDALVSFVYNTGTASAALFGRVNDQAPDTVAHWRNSYTTAGGVVMPGLIARRNSEAEMYAGGQRFSQVKNLIVGAGLLIALSVLVYSKKLKT